MKGKNKRYELLEKIFLYILKIISISTVLILAFIILFITKESIVVFKEISIMDFIFSDSWKPTSDPVKLGILPIILSTLYVSILAVAISLPMGVGVSILLNIAINKKIRNIVRPIIDLMAGIPSVIYGFWGLLVIVKFFEARLSFPTGESILAAGILLSIMILPYIISTCDESIAKLIYKYQLSSKALGVSKWYMIKSLILPSSWRAIISAIILGLSRAIGETMAVMMVIGNSPIYPRLFNKGQTISGLIALEMGGAQVDSMHYHGLFASGFILLIILLVINVIFYYFRKSYADIY